LKEERLAEVKSTTGVKDRLGAYQAATSEDAKNLKASERTAELKNASSVKERLNNYTAVADDTLVKNKTVVEEELKKAGDVKSRLANWNNVLSQDTPLSTDSSTIAERTAEAKAGSGLKDRLNVWNSEANKQPETATRKEPIKIDYGF
jgi:hypothetical protein